MARPNVAIVLGFILGIGFMLPFTLAFRAPAAAAPNITLQGLADRLEKTELTISRFHDNTTLADNVVAMGTQLNALQSRVNSLEKGIHENEAGTETALKTLQNDVGNVKGAVGNVQGAIGFLNAAATINSKVGAELSTVGADLATLKAAYNSHTHQVKYTNQRTLQSFDCNSKNALGVCADAGLVQVALPGTAWSEPTLKTVP